MLCVVDILAPLVRWWLYKIFVAYIECVFGKLLCVNDYCCLKKQKTHVFIVVSCVGQNLMLIEHITISI